MDSDDSNHERPQSPEGFASKMNFVVVGISMVCFLLVIVFLFVGLHLTNATSTDVNRTKTM
jgi:hypothetical protein